MFSTSGMETTRSAERFNSGMPVGCIQATLKPHHVLKVRATSQEDDSRRLDMTRVFAMALKYGLDGDRLRHLAIAEARRTADTMEGAARSDFVGLLNYVVDVHSNRSESEIASVFLREARSGLMIRGLAKTALVKFSLAKDVICDNCALAEHCLSTDGSRFDLSDDTIQDETEALDELEEIANTAEVGTDQRIWFRGYEEMKLRAPDGYTRVHRTPYAITTAGMLLAIVESSELANS